MQMGGVELGEGQCRSLKRAGTVGGGAGPYKSQSLRAGPYRGVAPWDDPVGMEQDPGIPEAVIGWCLGATLFLVPGC